jgi:hypothetical protein
VPSTVADALEEQYAALRHSWQLPGEPKGSALTDDQTASALRLLGQHDVLLFIAGLDAGNLEVGAVRELQRRQAEKIREGVDARRSAEGNASIVELAERFERLSTPLVAQLYVLMLVIEDVFRHAPTYYAQRSPAELGRFDWIVDPKDVRPTAFETTWRQIILPWLQTRSLRNPFPEVTEFDYSAMERFELHDVPSNVLIAIKQAGGRTDGPLGYDLGKLLESATFPDSRDSRSLQLVDIAASCFTKAMNGKLPPEVFRLLGPLMLQQSVDRHVVQLVALGDGPDTKASVYHRWVVNALGNRAKPMLAR